MHTCVRESLNVFGDRKRREEGTKKALINLETEEDALRGIFEGTPGNRYSLKDTLSRELSPQK